MEDTELEEGEACYYQNGDDSTIDPDVALSYIDEKIQDVLGHFQKDFEGGVSAENLGAKFGGYGSFLPTYQRSPFRSQPRTPPEVYYNMPRSPKSLDSEASQHNSSLAMRPGACSAAQTPSSDDQVKGDASVPLIHAEASTLNREFVQKPETSQDQKTMKVRIKVGRDNLPASKNAEIYSDLGLDGFPSSPLEVSYTDSEGLSHDFMDALDESPTSILKITAAFVRHGVQLLSPLSHDFVNFTQKEKYGEKTLSKQMLKGKENGYDSRKGSRKILSEKKPNAHEKINFLESANSSADALSKKETDIDSLACEELDSGASKLPFASNSNPSDSAKGAVTADLPMVANGGFARPRPPYEVSEEQPLEPESVQEIGRIQKSNGDVGLSGNISGSNKTIYVDNCTIPKKQGSHKGQRIEISAKAESIVAERGRALDAEAIDQIKANIIKGGTSNNEYVTNHTLGKEKLCMVGRSKVKGGQTHVAQEVEDVKNANDSLLYEETKNSHGKSLLSKTDCEDTRKENRKAKDKYHEFFGDLKFEGEDNEVASKEMSSTEKLKDSELVKKESALECKIISKENSKVIKNGKPSKAEEYQREKTHLCASGPKAIATLNVPAPLVNEDWVQCDKCQTWRLLPLGTNPKSLPEKWVCSMLYWLPAMNRCSVSEEETTQALRALYQVPAPAQVIAAPPETKCKPHDHPGKNLSGVSSTGASADIGQMLGQEGSFSKGKKRFKCKDPPSRPLGVESTQYPDTVKKNHQSSSSLAEKHGIIQRQKKSSLERSSAGGDTENLKTKNRGHSDFHSPRALKKVKTEDALYNNESFISDQGKVMLKAGHFSSDNSPNNEPKKDWHKSYNCSDDLKSNIPNHLSATEITPDDGSLLRRKCDSKTPIKKRKSHGDQATCSYTAHVPGVGHHSQENCENDQRKEKKARISRSELKDTTKSKSTGAIDKRASEMMDGQVGQDQNSSLPQRSLDATDSLKRDSGSVQPTVAATSSSSKVSGSCKKTSLQELKGSPVESVSSSPLRASTDKLVSTVGNLRGKDDIPDGSFLGTSSPIIFSDGKDENGRYSSGASKRDETQKVSHGSIESSMIDLQDKDLAFVSRSRKEENRYSPGFATHQPISDAVSRGNSYACKSQVSEHYQNDERKDDQCYNSGYHLKKLGNGPSSHSINSAWSLTSDYDKDKIKVSDSMNGYLDVGPSRDENVKEGRSKFQEKYCDSSVKSEKNVISERSSSGKDLSESSKCENQFASSYSSCDKLKAISKQETKQNVVLDTDDGKLSKTLLPDKVDGGEVSGRGKSHSLPPSARYKNDNRARLQPIAGSHKENGDSSRATKQSKKGEKNENPPISVRHTTSNTNKVRDHDGAPLRKDSSSQAATNAIKEAKDLKHMADRLKNSGSNQSTAMYFQAALKFLHGASLLESGNSENSKHNEIQSMQVYSSTAKLCEFCAHEYERCKDMAAAALAYKCMEVAYMRVIYSSRSSASRDRNELQTALQIVPPVGESPSSSASDLDNLNNPATVDKVSTKGINSPQVAGNNGITARNRSSLMRLLNFAQDVSNAMEAARKSRITFAAANPRTGEAHSRDGISSVKTALDFNFQDVDGLLRLVRIAMDAINR